jgi:autotransporter-associated beta strand protein
VQKARINTVDAYLDADATTCQVRVLAVNAAGSTAGTPVTITRPHTAPTLGAGVYWMYGAFGGGTLNFAPGSYTNYPCPLTLSALENNDATITHWVINWGDGSAPQFVTGDPSVVTHAYTQATAFGQAPYAITATAYDAYGSYPAYAAVGVEDAPADPSSWASWRWWWQNEFGFNVQMAPDQSGIEISWCEQAQEPSVTSFQLERSTDPNFGSYQVLTSNASACYYQDPGSIGGGSGINLCEQYYYRLDITCIVGPTNPAGQTQWYYTQSPTPLDPPPTLTAYRANNGGQVTADQVQSADPANYVILADNGYSLDSTGQLDDEDYNTQRIDNNTPIDTSNTNLARITLNQIDLPADQRSGMYASLYASDSNAVRFFDSTGKLLTAADLSVDLSNPTGPLAGILTGSVDVYVEGLSADSHVTISYGYGPSYGYGSYYNGYTSSTAVHMAVAEITMVDVQGNTVDTEPGIVTDQDLTDATGTDPNAAYTARQNILASEYKLVVTGLPVNDIQALDIPTDSSDDTTPMPLTATGSDTAEAGSFIVQYEPDESSYGGAGFSQAALSGMVAAADTPGTLWLSGGGLLTLNSSNTYQGATLISSSGCPLDAGTGLPLIWQPPRPASVCWPSSGTQTDLNVGNTIAVISEGDVTNSTPGPVAVTQDYVLQVSGCIGHTDTAVHPRPVLVEVSRTAEYHLQIHAAQRDGLNTNRSTDCSMAQRSFPDAISLGVGGGANSLDSVPH